MDKEKNCLFQYATKHEVIRNTDLITLEEAKILWNNYLPDLINKWNEHESPQMCIWSGCCNDTDYHTREYYIDFDDCVFKNRKFYRIEIMETELQLPFRLHLIGVINKENQTINMQLTKEQFYNYIKEHGITKAELTKDFMLSELTTIPKGTILYFGTSLKDLSTYEGDTDNKNIQFNYLFEVQWSNMWNDYKGKFKIIPEYTQVAMNKTESKIITKIKSLTAKINKLEDERNKLIEML